VRENQLKGLVDGVLQQAIDKQRIVGGVLLVSLGGHLVYERAIGAADRETQRAAKLDTIFRWASFTKVLIAVATMALAERGTLSLGDPVTRFLPDFRPKTADGRTPIITVRHLLTHTAGLTYGIFEPDGDGPYHRARVSDGLDQPGLSMETNLARIVSVPLAREPGTGWGYSIATDVLGHLLSHAAQIPLPQLVRDIVTAPLGMSDSDFTTTERDRLATAYSNTGSAPVRMGPHHLTPFDAGAISFAPDRMFDPDSYPSGGAGMSGTAADFMRLLEALRKGGAPVISKASIALLREVRPEDFEVFIPGWKWRLGWPVLVDPGKTHTPQSPGTWLWGGVYGNSWFVDPARELSVVLTTNTAPAGMVGPVPEGIRDAVYGALNR
jgi:CubicO group peptidase (beta-lactamase class C family)